MVLDARAVRSYVATLGVWGPVAVIGLVVLAILVTPIPSAPFALAAGAAYGHTRGTLYVLAGAELGAPPGSPRRASSSPISAAR